ncbi:DUF4252 domain-containing protein [Bacteroides sp.]|uniref:DUF4252 domain-containing protein n=1 Tax=Bacteroides sp. TaxID=29523 RepID=UPI002601ADE6|nr:DUF4252 domain-containing protein [Bacteroides sp.]MDD3036472.1 DUF4252 domain-containing protein [Bacteroides sp.]
MTKRYLYTILFLFCVNFCFAQNTLFDKYADKDNVTSVFISKKMFQMMPSVDTPKLNLKNMKNKIESLHIITAEDKKIQENMKNEFSALMKKDYDELMRIKDGMTKVNFYVKQKGNFISEMVMIVDSAENDFTVMQLLGNFTLKEIQEITNTMPQK